MRDYWDPQSKYFKKGTYIYLLFSIVVEADISSCSRRVLSNHDQNLAIGKKAFLDQLEGFWNTSDCQVGSLFSRENAIRLRFLKYI